MRSTSSPLAVSMMIGTDLAGAAQSPAGRRPSSPGSIRSSTSRCGGSRCSFRSSSRASGSARPGIPARSDSATAGRAAARRRRRRESWVTVSLAMEAIRSPRTSDRRRRRCNGLYRPLRQRNLPLQSCARAERAHENAAEAACSTRLNGRLCEDRHSRRTVNSPYALLHGRALAAAALTDLCRRGGAQPLRHGRGGEDVVIRHAAREGELNWTRRSRRCGTTWSPPAGTARERGAPTCRGARRR